MKRKLSALELQAVDATFPGFAYLAGQRAERTLSEYRYNTILYLRHCRRFDLPPLDPMTLRAWRQHLVLNTSFSPATILTRVSTIKSLVKAGAAIGAVPKELAYDFQAVERVRLSSSTFRDRTRRDQTRFLLSPEQVRQLCMMPDPTHFIGLRDRAMLFTMASSALRISEVARLRVDDIQTHDNEGYTIRTIGKGAEDYRIAPLSHESYQWLLRWLSVRASYVDSPWLFTAVQGGPGVRSLYSDPLTIHGIRYRIVVYGQQLGLPIKITAHMFRRFVASQLYSRTRDLRLCQKVLGHSQISTTAKHYLLDDGFDVGVTDDLF